MEEGPMVAGFSVVLTRRNSANKLRTSFLHIAETDCVAGHIGLELRCAKRKFISLNVRQYSDLPAPVQTRHVAFRE
jgi:hypothetical protein